MAVSSRNVADPPMGAERVPWVDYSKGWCIVLVVAMHSALGVGLALGQTGWLHEVVAFARPFRMPDFFIVAGLFVGRAINLRWRAYLDRKLVHFLYFYALWLLIVLATKASHLGIVEPASFLRAYVLGFVEPFSTMWFIQLLPLLFVTARLLRSVPWYWQIGGAACLHLVAASYGNGDTYTMGSVLTGWTTFDSFALYLVYFLIGHHFRATVFEFAQRRAERPLMACLGLVLWAVAHGGSVVAGWSALPGLTLIHGIAGALAVVTVSSLLARFNVAPWLAYCGRNSFVVYLAFVIPMAAARTVLSRLEFLVGPGWLSLMVALIAIAVPLLVEAVFRSTPLRFLFQRPDWARLSLSSARGIDPRRLSLALSRSSARLRHLGGLEINARPVSGISGRDVYRAS